MTFAVNVISSNKKENDSDRRQEIINTIAETVMYAPPEVCPSCIDKILKTARSKIIERGLLVR